MNPASCLPPALPGRPGSPPASSLQHSVLPLAHPKFSSRRVWALGSLLPSHSLPLACRLAPQARPGGAGRRDETEPPRLTLPAPLVNRVLGKGWQALSGVSGRHPPHSPDHSHLFFSPCPHPASLGAGSCPAGKGSGQAGAVEAQVSSPGALRSYSRKARPQE